MVVTGECETISSLLPVQRKNYKGKGKAEEEKETLEMSILVYLSFMFLVLSPALEKNEPENRLLLEHPI